MKSIYVFFALIFCLFTSSCGSVAGDNLEEESVSMSTGSFTLLGADDTGVDFRNHVEENFTNFFARFQYVYNGGGVAIGDIDGDGLSDLFFTANEGKNRLYRNMGELKFEDVTELSGMTEPIGWDNGTVMADVNGDGHLDIYVCRGGSAENSPPEQRRNLLYINDGSGKFREAAAELGLADEGYSLQAVFFDMDNDNDLDVYLTNRPDKFFIPPSEVVEGKNKQAAEFSDQLYRNDGGKFTRITLAAGITRNYGYGLGLINGDFNNDGFADILVSNDYLENDYLYENQGDGTFKEKISDYSNHTSFYGMGVDAVDIDNDGYEDLLQLDMSPEDYVRSKTTMASMNVGLYQELMEQGFHPQFMHNSLQLNRGNGFFSEIGQYAGIAKSDWSWAVLGADFDNDAQKEIFITNGYRRDMTNKDSNIRFQKYLRSEERGSRSDEENAQYVINMFDPVALQNYFFDTDQQRLRFTNTATDWGLTQEGFSNGAAYGDLDNDGDLDLVINNLEEDAFLYRNDSEHKPSLRIRLDGAHGNRFGIGAKISIQQERGLQFQEMRTVKGYLSSVEPIAHFGLGGRGTVKSISVVWQDGRETVLQTPQLLDSIVTLSYKDSDAKAAAKERPRILVQEISAEVFPVPIIHVENTFDDYASQVLLPHAHSKLGPAIAVADVNADGLEDFYLGGAKRIAGRLYQQLPDGQFRETSTDFVKSDNGSEDTAAKFFDVDNDGDQDLYVVSGGSEFPAGSDAFQDRLYLNDGSGNFQKSVLPPINSSGSCAVPYDMDGDGDLDLFIGGRVVPTQYPAAPQSYLLRNDGGRFTDVTAQLAPGLEKVGMVTSAVWTDLEGDGNAELVLVGEWMPITVFKWNGSTYKNVTATNGLSETTGWWNTLVSADVDDDGDDDLIAGNLGLNYKFQASAAKPFYVFASDFDNNGSNDIFLAKKNEGDLVPIRGRECSSQQVPEIAEKFPTYTAFAAADLDEIIDLDKPDAIRYEAREFASVWLENRDGVLVLHRLPMAAQLSVVNGIVCMDVNGDGRKDLLTAGNNFDVEIETTPADAGVGTLLLGVAGQKSFSAVQVQESGLFLPGNVRGLYPIKLSQGSVGILVPNNQGSLQMVKLLSPKAAFPPPSAPAAAPKPAKTLTE